MSGFLSSLVRPVRRFLPRSLQGERVVVPVVRLSGVIGAGLPFSQSLTLAGVSKTLDKAFAMKDAAAVALLINSPGGAPVQSHLIHKRIRALAQEKNRHVFAFVEDAAASGGYMIACAADEIIADPMSIVGSIGVVSASFGFDKAMAKLGVERRVYTAGTRKVTLDPFRPEQPEDVERFDALLRETHTVFADLVRARRGDALKGDDAQLFSGEFWLGGQALALGLVDGLGDVRSVLRARYGEKVETPLIQAGSSLPWRRSGGLSSLVARRGAEGALAAAEERAMWARFGL